MAKKKATPLWISVLPLFVFLGIAGVSYSLLTQEGRDVSALPSALLDVPAPKLQLPSLDGATNASGVVPGITPDSFDGRLSIVNIFASWCIPCREEHPQIVKLGADKRIQLIGLNHRDSAKNARAFLQELGNPYDLIGVDRNGRASIEWGVYGVPETFLVNQNGIVFYKHVGPISPEQLEKIILPLIEQQLSEPS
ncbi:MAG: DsbE family thiol:disulfide interchange protein [Pseudomonadota bacterium]